MKSPREWAEETEPMLSAYRGLQATNVLELAFAAAMEAARLEERKRILASLKATADEEAAKTHEQIKHELHAMGVRLPSKSHDHIKFVAQRIADSSLDKVRDSLQRGME